MKHSFFKRRCGKIALCMVIISILALLFSCAGGAKISSSGLGKASDPVPFMANAKTGTLPSGLRYYLLENRQPEGRAFLALAVNAGSVLETEDERGLAHFVEHMAFNGTERFAKSELISYLRSLGMRFGPEINAYTSFDETVYEIEVPVETGPNGRKVIPDMALAVLDDWTRAVTFRGEDVEAERLVIMEEYRTRLGPNERLVQEMYPLLFRGSPYEQRLPIGLPAVIQNAPASRLEGFYKKWYRPENMAVIIVGDFDTAFLEASLAGHFPAQGWTAQQPLKRPQLNLDGPKKGSLQTLIFTDDELGQSEVDLYWKRKAEPKPGNLGSYREDIINTLSDIMLSLRFEEESSKSETPYMWGGSGRADFAYSSGFYIIAAQPKAALVNETLNALFLVKESLSRFGFTQGETESAKAYLLSNLEQRVSEKDHQPSPQFTGRFTSHFLKNEIVPDAEWELEALTKLLPGITLKEINKATKGYFAEDDLTVIISAPKTESVPTEAQIAAMAAQARRAKIAAPDASGGTGELLSRVPEPGRIVSETTDSETGAIRMTLSNGAELILKETKNKNSEVSLYAQARGGVMSAPDENLISAQITSDLLAASGLGPYSRTELTKMLLDKQVSLSFWTQNYLRGFQGASSVKDLKTLFELLHLNFTQPRLEPDAIKALLDSYVSILAQQENNPTDAFRREITRTINGNPRLHPLEAADMAKVNLDDAMAFIRACLNPADYTFVFSGSIDIPLIRSLAETYLASLPVTSAFNQWAVIDQQRPSGVKKELYRGREDRSMVYLSWFTPQQFTEENSAKAAVLAGYLEIQLNDVIREDLGGVYGISSWSSLSPIPAGELSGGAMFICEPRRLEELVAAVKAEFQKIASGNISDDVFGKAVEALVKNHEESIQRNLHIAQSYANLAVIYRAPLSRLDKQPAMYRTVRHADIQEMASLFMRGNLAELFLYPERN